MTRQLSMLKEKLQTTKPLSRGEHELGCGTFSGRSWDFLFISAVRIWGPENSLFPPSTTLFPVVLLFSGLLRPVVPRPVPLNVPPLAKRTKSCIQNQASRMYVDKFCTGTRHASWGILESCMALAL